MCLEEKKFVNKQAFHILIVEDARVINDKLTKNLKKEDYHCSQAYTLEEAHKIVEEEDIDLIILDLHLPDGDGEEFLHLLKTEKPQTKVVVFTADDDLARRDELFRLGIVDYIFKGKNSALIQHEISSIITTLTIAPQYTVLIVDDSFTSRKIIKSILSPMGYNLLEAANAAEAFSILQQHKVDLVLLDMELPDMNGMEVLKTIKSKPEYFHLPIFIVSSDSHIETVRNAYKEGAMHYFTKPFSPEELKLKVEQIVKLKHNHKQLQCQARISNSCQAFFDHFCAVAVVDSKLSLLYTNEKFSSLFEAASSSLFEIFQKRYDTFLGDILMALKEHKSVETKLHYNKRDISVKIFPLEDAKLLLVFEHTQSITP